MNTDWIKINRVYKRLSDGHVFQIVTQHVANFRQVYGMQSLEDDEFFLEVTDLFYYFEISEMEALAWLAK